MTLHCLWIQGHCKREDQRGPRGPPTWQCALAVTEIALVMARLGSAKREECRVGIGAKHGNHAEYRASELELRNIDASDAQLSLDLKCTDFEELDTEGRCLATRSRTACVCKRPDLCRLARVHLGRQDSRPYGSSIHFTLVFRPPLNIR